MRSYSDTEPAHFGIDARLAGLAAAQHGVFSRGQVLEHGGTVGAIRWRLRTGRWQVVHPGVYRLHGAPPTWLQRATAACLFLGDAAVVSHRAAAHLHGLMPQPAHPIVTVPRGRNRAAAAGTVVLRWTTRPCSEHDRARLHGVPVTRPARTLLDLAATEPDEVEDVLDLALRRGLVSLRFLDHWLQGVERTRGRPALVRQVRLRWGRRSPESPLEAAVLRLLRDAGMPTPVLQHEVRDGRRLIARVDLAYPEQRVAIEADGFRYHDRRGTFDDERARGNRLEALGWRVLRITSSHVERDRGAVVAWVTRALDAGRSGG